MAEVFLIYGSEDRSVAAKVVEHLSKRWTVWWDDTLTGDFRSAIPQQIAAASCVVALWSKTSVAKTASVGEDMEIAKQHGIVTIPVELEECGFIYGFSNLSKVVLHSWNLEEDAEGFQQLVRKISTVVPEKKSKKTGSVFNGAIALPAKFLSISSHETRLDPLPAVQAAQLSGAQTILVSAYDTHPSRCAAALPKLLSDYRQSGGIVLLDSGNYEASRRGDKAWCVERLWEALEFIPPDMAFCFDEFNVPKPINQIIDNVVSAAQRDQVYTSAKMLPIVHTSRRDDGSYDFDKLPQIIRGVASRLRPEIVAVPERELGSGLIQRARTVRAIRQALNELDVYQPIHLLGTGNPWSIITLTAAGADTFDGLEWCRTVVDHDSGRLHHDQHYDFFSFQDGREPSTILAEVARNPHINFAGKVAFHNIFYFLRFTRELRAAVSSGTLEEFARGVLGSEHVSALSQEFPELFQ